MNYYAKCSAKEFFRIGISLLGNRLKNCTVKDQLSSLLNYLLNHPATKSQTSSGVEAWYRSVGNISLKNLP